jgi:hypothetical protein
MERAAVLRATIPEVIAEIALAMRTTTASRFVIRAQTSIKPSFEMRFEYIGKSRRVKLISRQKKTGGG